MNKVILPLVFAMFGAQAAAQSLTVEDIRAQIEAEQSQPNPYEALLADPDPLIARRAMEIMIESGDPVLRDIAIEFGVNSPDPEFRHLALLAWFQGNPQMEIVVENNGSPDQDFRRLARARGSEPNAQGRFIWLTRISGYNSQETCFVAGSQCLFRHTPNGAWIRLSGVWQEIGINDNGQLSGVVQMSGTEGPRTVRANVRFNVPVP